MGDTKASRLRSAGAGSSELWARGLKASGPSGLRLSRAWATHAAQTPTNPKAQLSRGIWKSSELRASCFWIAPGLPTKQAHDFDEVWA